MNKYIDYTLPHGGKLRYVKNKVSKSTMFEICFDCGARLDPIPGISHFVEHLFFTGTKDSTEEQLIDKYYNFINVNAYTTYNVICFVGNVITEEFGQYLDLLCEMLTKSTFTPKAVRKEAKVVQQEIATRRDDNYGKSWWLNFYNLIHTDYYKYEILGTNESIASVRDKDVWDYVKKYIVAESLIVKITSPMSFRKIKKLFIEKIESKLNRNPNFESLPYWSDTIADDRFYCVEHKDIGKTYLHINFAFDLDVFDFKKSTLINFMLKLMNHTSGLHKSLRTKKSLVYGCNIRCIKLGKQAILYFATECDKKNINEVISTLAKYLLDTLKNGFSEEVIKQIKHTKKHSDEVEEPRSSKAFSKLEDFYLYGKIRNTKKLNKYAQNITLEECNECFKSVFASPRVSATIYGDITKEEAMGEQEFYNLFNFSKRETTKTKKQTKAPATSKKSAKQVDSSKKTRKSIIKN